MAEKIELNTGHLLPESVRGLTQSKDSGAYNGGQKLSKELARKAKKDKNSKAGLSADKIALDAIHSEKDMKNEDSNKEKPKHDINHNGHIDIVI